MLRILLLLIICFITSSSLSAQKFYCSAEKEVIESSTFEIELVIEDGEGKNLQLPKVEGAKLVGGPSTSTQMSIVNGQRSSVYKQIYAYLVESKSEIKVGEASVLIKGKKFSSQPFSIKVKKSEDFAKSLKGVQGDFIVRMEADFDKAYLGQQIAINYLIYYNREIQINQIISESKYEGFYSNRLENVQSSDKEINFNGKRYLATKFHRVMLFPQKVGTFKIDPIVLKVSVPSKNSRKSFFGYSEMDAINLSSNSLNISVSDLPSNTKTFSGGVGEFSLQSTIDKNDLTTDDGLAMTILLKGNGDKRTTKLPVIIASNNFEIYEPKVLEEQESVEGETVVHYKKLEYLLVPKKVGQSVLKAEFTYFDPNKKEYITITSNPVKVNVTQGAKPISQSSSIQKDSTITNSSHSWIWFLIIPLFLGISYFGYSLYRKKVVNNLDPIVKNKQLASKRIAKHLHQAKSFLDKGNDKEFYHILSASLGEYLRLKFNIPTELHSKEYISEYLSNVHSSKLAEKYVAILNGCDAALYGFGDQYPPHKMYGEVKELMEEIETIK